jgi:hypothetical protein
VNEIELNSEALALIEESKPFLAITNDVDFGIANEYLQKNKALQKRIETYFDPEIEAANKVHKGLCSKKKAALASLIENYKAVAKAGSDYQLEQAQKREEEQRLREEEARLKAEADKKAIIAEAEKAEAAGDYQAASDFIDQVQDVQVLPIVPVPQEIHAVKTVAGSTTWIHDREVTFDPAQIKQLFIAVSQGELPIECLTVKTGPLKDYFEKQGIWEYDQYGVKCTKISRPTTRV